MKSGGTVQYCKIVCDKGSWRGPYCGQTRERLGGADNAMIVMKKDESCGITRVLHTVLWVTLITDNDYNSYDCHTERSKLKWYYMSPLSSERVFRHGCHLEAPLSGLQLREGHRLVPPGQVLLHSYYQGEVHKKTEKN